MWKNTELVLDHENGPGSTPVLHNGRILLCCDGRDVQYLAALDAATGKLLWKSVRSQVINKKGDFRKAYGTPVVIRAHGREIILTTAAEHLYAHDIETGKELWFIKYPGFSNVPLPLYRSSESGGTGLIYVCTGFGKPELWAVKPGAPNESGDLTATHVAWRYKIQAPEQSSPLLLGERIYMVNDRGLAQCINAKTGELVWKQSLNATFSASPLLADNRIYFFDRDGVCTVIKPGDAFEQAAKNTLEAGFMASPAPLPGALILRTKTHLYRIGK